MKLINFLLNIVWILVAGILSALIWLISGLLLCITVVGIPFGIQNFKFAKLSFAPFGKKIKTKFFKHPIMNLIWLVLLGWEMCILFIIAGLICCITVVGVPLGIQAFKMCKLAIAPFGAKVS